MKQYKVIIPTGLEPLATSYEVSAAILLANHFRADVEFVPRSNQKTPDFKISGLTWELKSPTGKGKHNIEHQMKDGVKQSNNIIFDARRSKIHMRKIRSELQNQLNRKKVIKRLMLIEKTKGIVEITRS